MECPPSPLASLCENQIPTCLSLVLAAVCLKHPIACCDVQPEGCCARTRSPVLLSGLWTTRRSSSAFPFSTSLAIKIPGFALRSAAVMTRLEMLLLGSVLPSIISKAQHLAHSAGVLNKTASSLGCQLPSNLQYATALASEQSLLGSCNPKHLCSLTL